MQPPGVIDSDLDFMIHLLCFYISVMSDKLIFDKPICKYSNLVYNSVFFIDEYMLFS